jgi:hypothetical protein
MTPNDALSHRLRGAVVVGCIVVLLAVVSPSSSVATALPALSVTGTIDGLYPGFEGELIVRVGNPLNRSIRLTSLTTTAERLATGCERHLVIGGLIGQTIVPARAELDLAIRVAFDRATPDTCQGVSMPLVFALNAAEAATDPTAAGLPHAGSDPMNLVNLATTTFALGAGIVLLERRRQR